MLSTLIQDILTTYIAFPLMTNSTDPEQLASKEANWSGSTLFAKAGHIPGSARGGFKLNVERDVKHQIIITMYDHDCMKWENWKTNILPWETAHSSRWNLHQRSLLNSSHLTKTASFRIPRVQITIIITLVMWLKHAGWMANSADPDLSLHCLWRHIWLNR